MNQKRRIQAGSIALYVLAVLLLCYGAYMAFSAYTYVADYYGYQGTDITANLGEAFQYVISQSCLYICFSIVFYVMGLLLQKLNDLHDFLPREYLRPKEVEEQDVEIAEGRGRTKGVGSSAGSGRTDRRWPGNRRTGIKTAGMTPMRGCRLFFVVRPAGAYSNG